MRTDFHKKKRWSQHVYKWGDRRWQVQNVTRITRQHAKYVDPWHPLTYPDIQLFHHPLFWPFRSRSVAEALQEEAQGSAVPRAFDVVAAKTKRRIATYGIIWHLIFSIAAYSHLQYHLTNHWASARFTSRAQVQQAAAWHRQEFQSARINIISGYIYRDIWGSCSQAFRDCLYFGRLTLERNNLTPLGLLDAL